MVDHLVQELIRGRCARDDLTGSKSATGFIEDDHAHLMKPHSTRSVTGIFFDKINASLAFDRPIRLHVNGVSLIYVKDRLSMYWARRWLELASAAMPMLVNGIKM